MARSLAIAACVLGLASWTGPARAADYAGLFDVELRRSELQRSDHAQIRQACLAIEIDREWAELEPIPGLSSTSGYGSDRRANEFNWAVMVLAGRALAGDGEAELMLKNLFLEWADAKAFSETEVSHDSYYALKRVVLPAVVAFSILEPRVDAEESAKIAAWLDPLVRRVDRTFDGDVDHNNHRYLADSVLTVWGAIAGDDDLYAKGLERLKAALEEARRDGSLPLEVRRGSRALWYTRQALASFAVIAETARGRGEDLYALSVDNRSYWTLFGFLLNGLAVDLLVHSYAAENYIPGPEIDYRKQDRGFLDTRSNGRHYLAFTEAIVTRSADLPSAERIRAFVDREAVAERPLIDEFAGGNATCFWGAP